MRLIPIRIRRKDEPKQSFTPVYRLVRTATNSTKTASTKEYGTRRAFRTLTSSSVNVASGVECLFDTLLPTTYSQIAHRHSRRIRPLGMRHQAQPNITKN